MKYFVKQTRPAAKIRHFNWLCIIFIFTLGSQSCGQQLNPIIFEQALENGKLANEGFGRCRHFIDGWLNHADLKTGLIPRNLRKDKDIWNARDSAADNYPFMVLTAAITDRPLYNGRLLEILKTETKLTSRLMRLPDTWSFSKQAFHIDTVDTAAIIFGSSEYVKDGLLPLTEWLGHSPWFDRMIQIVDDLWQLAPVETPFGNIISTSQEVNGEMLQVLSRIFWMTGEPKYLEWAIRLGDYYLLANHHPTRDENQLRLRDHGCEIISGLCELYATVHHAKPAKKKNYQPPVHAMLDRILAVGRNEHGLFYNSVNPQNGKPLHQGISDTWGYTFNGFYTVYLIDQKENYRQAVLKALACLNDNFREYNWENGSADGYADTIESALNLYNREPIPSAAKWIDYEMQLMWPKQQPDGVIEGWHGDGNFARTTIMYCLWKTQGITIKPWRKDVIFGAVQTGDSLFISIRAEKAWQGKLLFDKSRHAANMKLPFDWPRINQFPEWFTVLPEKHYQVIDLSNNSPDSFTGNELIEGFEIQIKAGREVHLLVQ